MSLQQVAVEAAEGAKLDGDLGQLPGHHPLIKDGMSDEGLLHQLQQLKGTICNILALITVQILDIQKLRSNLL